MLIISMGEPPVSKQGPERPADVLRKRESEPAVHSSATLGAEFGRGRNFFDTYNGFLET